MRIAVIGGYAPSLINFRGPLLARMVALGHEVHGLAPAHVPDVGPQLEALGADYHRIPLSRRGMNPLADIGALLHIKQALQRIRPDMVLSYTFKPVVYGSLAARMVWVGERKRVYAMITGLGYAFTEEPAGLRRRILFNVAKGMYRSGINACDGIIFQNPDDENFFQRLGVVPERVATTVVGGSGVDLDHYAVAPLPQETVFLCLSRLLKSKGVGLFAEAAARLKARHPGAVFRLAGPLESGGDAVTPDEIAAWRRDGALEVLDPVDDVRPLLAGASVYVLPSHYREGVPRSILEAMSMGRAVVTTDAPGCRETVEPGLNGFLVPPRDVESLTQAMERFILDPALARTLGAASRARAEARFDVNRVNDAILAFMGLLPGGPGAEPGREAGAGAEA
ncbi:glycosyltransferase [Pseudodesulfovibrio sp. F-1]|uniref:Glycosyltransferase n=1 Tax=Pseudodesulfovibrio alkaliphilus TaxID=2661613 RepID=A0A7K1KL58_9BACT|nr:glycosyltransferase family 4 protein [Pseudodesulfovibrio alkaliphilus]MUM76632.1 glycosyltransferase [Pseudodesulfovibrio alkaliphilus]